MQYEYGSSGLFVEFGKSFVVELMHMPLAYPGINISRSRRMRDLICVVHEDYFDDIDRGYPWEVGLTDEEPMRVLSRTRFTLPSTVEMLEMQLTPRHIYADTDAKKAIFQSNVDNLRRMLWQHRSKEPKPYKYANHRRMYLYSEVMISTPTFMSSIVSDIMSSTTPRPSIRTICPPVYIPDPDIPSEIVSNTPLTNAQDKSSVASQPRKRKTKTKRARQSNKPRLDSNRGLMVASLVAFVWLLFRLYVAHAEHAKFLATYGVNGRPWGY